MIHFRRKLQWLGCCVLTVAATNQGCLSFDLAGLGRDLALQLLAAGLL